MCVVLLCCVFVQAEDGIRDLVRSRGLGDVYKRQDLNNLSLWADIAVGQDTIRVYTAHLASLRFGDKDYDFIRTIEQGGGSDSLATAGSRIMGRMKDAFLRRSGERLTLIHILTRRRGTLWKTRWRPHP